MSDMRRREFITLLGGAAVAWPLAARAQQPSKIARVGFFRQSEPVEKHFNAFRSGLRALGYVEGQNLTIEQRYAAGAYDRLDELAADLVRLNPDVIVVDGTAAAKAAKAATADVPIVFALGADPVDGLVRSMARPEANLTGFTLTAGYQMAGKRVELLKDIKPDLTRLAVLINPGNPTTKPYLRETERAAGVLSLAVRTFDARSVDDLTPAFAAMVEWRAEGVTTLSDAIFYSRRERIVALTQENKLAGVHPESAFVEVGGLLAYGASLSDLFQRAASYAGRILKGTRPSDLPVEQPSKFELVVNLKTARFLGLTISRDFLLRADEVIE
jgi:putative tryptophan/tyrosine transport system substrate-binding protein